MSERARFTYLSSPWLFQVAGSPASHASVLHPGDVILEVDGLDVHKASSQDVMALLKVVILLLVRALAPLLSLLSLTNFSHFLHSREG